MRRFGSLVKVLPYSYNMMLIGSLALAGFPFLSGFYSKDLILETAFSKYEVCSLFSYTLGSISAFFTAFYSGRLLFLTFLGSNNQYKWNKYKIHEGNKSLGLILLVLVLGSLFSGYLFKDMFVGFGSIFFENSILILSKHSVGFDIEIIPIFFKLIPTIFTFSGLCLSFIFYNNSYLMIINKFIVSFYTFLSTKWFFDFIYNYYIGNFVLNISYHNCYKLIDKGFLEYFGVTGLTNIIYMFSIRTIQIQNSGFIYNYISIMLLSFFFLLIL